LDEALDSVVAIVSGAVVETDFGVEGGEERCI